MFNVVREQVHDDIFALFMMESIIDGEIEPARNFGRKFRRRQAASNALQLSGLIVRSVPDQEKILGQYCLPKGLGLYQRVGYFKLATCQTEIDGLMD